MIELRSGGCTVRTRCGRTQLALPALAAALLLVLAACGGDGSSAEPSPSESPEAESTSPSPSETEQAGPPEQPRGKHGVTYDIQNWDEYAEEPVVLAWKQAREAGAASINQGEMVQEALRLNRGPARRQLVAGAQQSWENNWHMKKVSAIRIQDVRQRGDRARVVSCEWAPGVSAYQQNGDAIAPVEKEWRRAISQLRQQGEQWRITTGEYDGNCKGGPPQ